MRCANTGHAIARVQGAAYGANPLRDLPRTLMSACRAVPGEPRDCKSRDSKSKVGSRGDAEMRPVNTGCAEVRHLTPMNTDFIKSRTNRRRGANAKRTEISRRKRMKRAIETGRNHTAATLVNRPWLMLFLLS